MCRASTLQSCTQILQGPSVLQWQSSPSPKGMNWPWIGHDLLEASSPVCDQSRMSSVTSEVSDAELNGLLTATPLPNGEEQMYWDSMHVALNEPADWAPPEDWQLPPPATTLHARDVVPTEGTLSSTELGTTMLALPGGMAQSTGSACNSHSQWYLAQAAQSPSAAWKTRPNCDICKLKEASQASLRPTGNDNEWDMFACRFCAAAVMAKEETIMIKLRGRCTECPRYATFAPPRCPPHISLHCKVHKWEGEVNKAKRMSGASGSTSLKLLVDGSSQVESSDFPLSPPLSLQSFGMDDEDILSGYSSSVTASCATSHSTETRRDSRESWRATTKQSHSRSRSVSLGRSMSRSMSRMSRSMSLGGSSRGTSSRSTPSSMDTARSISCGNKGFVADAMWDDGWDTVGDWPLDTSQLKGSLQHTDAPKVVLTTAALLKQCREAGCGAKAAFGSTGDGVAKWCKQHSKVGEVRLSGGVCTHAGGCLKRASFGDAEQGIVRFCGTHKMSWHTNLRALRCSALHCNRHSIYGPACARLPTLCSKHRGEGHVDLRHTRRASPSREASPT